MNPSEVFKINIPLISLFLQSLPLLLSGPRVLFSVLSAVAEIERENILVQTMEGRKQKAREGKWNGGFAPYGYYLEKGELKIAEDEAETIRIIFDKYINTNMGANGIAKYLNQHGIAKSQGRTAH